MNTQLEEIIKKHEMSCAVAIDANGDLVGHSPDKSNTLGTALASSLIGPYGNPKNTFNSLEGMILPQVQSQGELVAFMDRPQNNIMVIVFGTCNLASKELYFLSKKVSETINSYTW